MSENSDRKSSEPCAASARPKAQDSQLRIVVVAIETDKNGEFCPGRKCIGFSFDYIGNEVVGKKCIMFGEPLFSADKKQVEHFGEENVYSNLIRCPACRAAEIEVDEEILKWAQETIAYRKKQPANRIFTKNDNWSLALAEAYLKIATAAGRGKG